MSHKIKRNAGTLHLLARGKPNLIKSVIKAADSELIKCICECAQNVLQGNFPLSPKQKKKLNRFKKDLRFISKKASSVKKRKKVIQKGGFLSALLGPLLGSVIPTIAKGLFER